MLDSLVKHRRYVAWLFAILLLALVCPTAESLLVGTLFVLFGAIIRIWASGCIEKNVAIAWSGPYRYVRNPLYIGSFFIGLGFCLMSNRWLPLAVFILLYFSVYRRGVLTEEDFLKKKFSHDFRRYCQHVPRFIPRFTPTREASVGWRWHLVIKHHEYNTWLAALALYVIMGFAIDYQWGATLYGTGFIFGP